MYVSELYILRQTVSTKYVMSTTSVLFW